jgi:RNA polymerase sigma factor (sigma-70 family)
MSVKLLESDADLALRVRLGGPQGDEAYEELLHRHEAAVRAATKGLFAVGWDYQDLLLEAKVGLWEAALSWSGRDSFAPYVHMVARRKVITLVVASTRGKASPMRSFAELDLLPGSEVPIWDGGVARQVEPLLCGADLTERERATLIRCLEGFPYDEIAAELGIKRKDVDNARQRAVKKVRAHLETQGAPATIA